MNTSIYLHCEPVCCHRYSVRDENTQYCYQDNLSHLHSENNKLTQVRNLHLQFVTSNFTLTRLHPSDSHIFATLGELSMNAQKCSKIWALYICSRIDGQQKYSLYHAFNQTFKKPQHSSEYN